MRRWGVCAVVLGLVLASAPLPCFAAEPSKTELAAARDLFSRAERDEEAGHWADALDKLRRAGTVKMTPGIRFHVALCEEKMGQLVAALADYVAAEAAARAEGNKDVLDAISDPLVALRGRMPTVTITPPADAKDASVTLDGAPLSPGLLGTPVPVDVGTHTVQAHAAGRPPFATTLNVFERQAAKVDVLMAPGAPLGAALASARADESNPESTQAGASRTAAIVSAASAAALVGFGVASYLVAGGKQSSAETACLRVVSCDDLKGGVRTWDALALGAWIAGAGAAAVSVYFWTRPSGSSERPAQASLGVGPGTVLLRGEF